MRKIGVDHNTIGLNIGLKFESYAMGEKLMLMQYLTVEPKVSMVISHLSMPTRSPQVP